MKYGLEKGTLFGDFFNKIMAVYLELNKLDSR